VILVLICVSLIPTVSNASALQQSPTGTPIPPQYANLVAKAKQQGSVRVIVALNTTFRPEGKLGQVQKLAQRSAISSAKAQVLSTLSTLKATPLATDWQIPYMALDVDDQALLQLVNSPQVVSIQEDRILH